LLDKDEWKSMATRMVDSIGYLITNEPNYMSNWGIVFSEIKKGMAEVVFVGESNKERALEFSSRYEPFALLMGTTVSSELPLLQGKTVVNGKDTIYVCYNKACQRPVHNVKDAFEQVRSSE
jgi:uncharacterized protein YyaL (SSP411 family)